MLKINNPNLVLEYLADKEITSDSYVLKKLICFKALSNGHKTAEVAELILTPARTIQDWVTAWNQEGFDSLIRGLPTGRHSQLSKDDFEKIKAEFTNHNTFSVADVQQYIHDEFNVDFGIRWVEIILKRKFGFFYSKPYVLPAEQPENAKEILELAIDKVVSQVFEEQQINSLDNVAFGFLDEASPQNKANTSRVWSAVSSPVVVKSGKKINANTVGFYAINGNSAVLSLESSKKESISGILKEIRIKNEEKKAIILVLDNCSVHRSKFFVEEAKKQGIYLVFLPPYSPNLNPIEFIWKSIKKSISQKNFH